MDQWNLVKQFRASEEGDAISLLGSRCRDCNASYFPSRKWCRKCGTEMDELELVGPGIVHSYTHVHRSFPGFDTPFIVALIDFPEGPRVPGQIRATKGSLINIGELVETISFNIAKTESGDPVEGYAFRVLSQEYPRGGA